MVLLDTHALIWAMYAPDKLSASAIDAMKRQAVGVSIASLWEMSIKIAKGNLKLKNSITQIAEICDESDIVILNITPAHCEYLQKLGNYHSDPFDRIIIAQSHIEGYPLITADQNIWKGYPEIEKIW